jgi:hypothetical protein
VFILISLLVFLSTLVHHGNDFFFFRFFFINFSIQKLNNGNDCGSRLHGVCKENPLAPLIGRLGLPLYRTSGDNSVLYDHDLER